MSSNGLVLMTFEDGEVLPALLTSNGLALIVTIDGASDVPFESG